MISDRYARNRKLRILQIFNRYEFVGGEEIIVERIGKALALFHTVGKFLWLDRRDRTHFAGSGRWNMKLESGCSLPWPGEPD
jgi:hypothetical protein